MRMLIAFFRRVTCRKVASIAVPAVTAWMVAACATMNNGERPADQVMSVWTTAIGTSYSKAVAAAKIAAVEEVGGVAVLDHREVSGEALTDHIWQQSGGVIRSWKVVDANRRNGYWKVAIDAKVERGADWSVSQARAVDIEGSQAAQAIGASRTRTQKVISAMQYLDHPRDAFLVDVDSVSLRPRQNAIEIRATISWNPNWVNEARNFSRIVGVAADPYQRTPGFLLCFGYSPVGGIPADCFDTAISPSRVLRGVVAMQSRTYLGSASPGSMVLRVHAVGLGYVTKFVPMADFPGVRRFGEILGQRPGTKCGRFWVRCIQSKGVVIRSRAQWSVWIPIRLPTSGVGKISDIRISVLDRAPADYRELVQWIPESSGFSSKR